MVVGLLTMAVGAILFVPAASVPSFALFLTALLILAAGITGLQVAANPYVRVLGQPENGFEPTESDAGFQLPRYDSGSSHRRPADSERCAIGRRRAKATV